MTRVRKALKQRGISPKLLADLIVSLGSFALLTLTGLDVDKDPILLGLLAKGAGFLAGVIVGPGYVVVADEPADNKAHPANLEF